MSRSVRTVLFHGQFVHGIIQYKTDLEHLYRIFSIQTHDKHQWLLLQFIVLLMMDKKGVRNMYSIPAVVNKHNTARVASCWFTIYYKYNTIQHSDTLRWFLLVNCGTHGNKRNPRTFVNLTNEIIIVSRKCVVMLVNVASMSVMGRSVKKVRIIIKVDISPLKVLLLVSDFKKLEFMPQVLVTEYQISRKYLQRERIVQAEGWKEGRKARDWAKSRLQQLCESA